MSDQPQISITVSAPIDDPLLMKLLSGLATMGAIAAPTAAATATDSAPKPKRGRPPKAAAEPVARKEVAPPAEEDDAGDDAEEEIDTDESDEPSLTLDDVRGAAKETLEALSGDPTAMKVVMKRFKAQQLKDIPPAKYAAFVKAMAELRSTVE